MSGRSSVPFSLFLLLFPVAFLSAAARVVPEDASFTAFLRPSGTRLDLLIRVPAAAFNEIQFPVLPGTGYLDRAGAESMLPGLARYWVADSLDVYENGSRLPAPRIGAIRVAPSADKSFASFELAQGHFAAPESGQGLDAFWSQVWLDVQLEYPIQSDRSEFAISTRFARFAVRATTSVKFLPPDGSVRTFEYQGDPGLVRLDPGWTEVAAQFLRWGFAGVVENSEYLLIVVCLVLPLRRIRAALPVALGFVSAGALTFFASASGLASDGLWFHPLTQTLVAVSIIVAAAQNIAGGVRPARRALEALVFGLIFGFDFSFLLAEKAQFGGVHGTAATLAFGAGAVLSLLAVFAVLPPVLRLLFHFTNVERAETIVLSMLAAHAAWHWMTERWERLARFQFRFPAMDLAFLALAMRWMMILVIFGGIVWFASGFINSKSEAA